MLVDFLKALEVEKQQDYKVGFSTYSFYKTKNNVIEVDCTNSGWMSAKIVNIPDTIENEMEFLHNLNWN